jgi:hypothetical protein
MNQRIWDKFLTERDKAVFAAGGFGARAGFGKRPALLASKPRNCPAITATSIWTR